MDGVPATAEIDTETETFGAFKTMAEKPIALRDIPKGTFLRKVFIYSQMDFHRGASVAQQARNYDGRELTPTFTTKEPIDLGGTYYVSQIVAAVAHINRGEVCEKPKLVEKLRTAMDAADFDMEYDAVGVYGCVSGAPSSGL